jgi:hypothetical protein
MQASSGWVFISVCMALCLCAAMALLSVALSFSAAHILFLIQFPPVQASGTEGEMITFNGTNFGGDPTEVRRVNGAL